MDCRYLSFNSFMNIILDKHPLLIDSDKLITVFINVDTSLVSFIPHTLKQSDCNDDKLKKRLSSPKLVNYLIEKREKLK